MPLPCDWMVSHVIAGALVFSFLRADASPPSPRSLIPPVPYPATLSEVPQFYGSCIFMQSPGHPGSSVRRAFALPDSVT